MRPILCGGAGGVIVAGLILVAGTTAAAWIAIAAAVLVLVAGAVDYVRARGEGPG